MLREWISSRKMCREVSWLVFWGLCSFCWFVLHLRPIRRTSCVSVNGCLSIGNCLSEPCFVIAQWKMLVFWLRNLLLESRGLVDTDGFFSRSHANSGQRSTLGLMRVLARSPGVPSSRPSNGKRAYSYPSSTSFGGFRMSFCWKNDCGPVHGSWLCFSLELNLVAVLTRVGSRKVGVAWIIGWQGKLNLETEKSQKMEEGIEHQGREKVHACEYIM